MMVDAGTYALWAMTASVYIMLASIALKTKWTRSVAGVNEFLLSLGFTLTMTLIVLATLDLLPDWLRLVARILIYVPLAIVLIWRASYVWYKNRGFWAWTKEDSVDGS